MDPMCGIVGGVAERNVVPILVEGLRRLEYRGYDSAGLAVLNGHHHLARLRAVGKVKILQEALDASPISGHVGIAHTRWATHGVPTMQNAHPHVSRDGIAIVHNGIIENHESLRGELTDSGYLFTSETDTEVIAHRIHQHLENSADLHEAVRKTVAELRGAYALAVVCEKDPECIVLAREGCPVVVGLGIDENFVASDVAALLLVTRRFMFLEEGDVAEIRRKSIRITDAAGRVVSRPVHESDLAADAVERGQYRHYMLKEIHEQPRAIAQTLEERVAGPRLLDAAFGPGAQQVFAKTRGVHIAACGTSYHAGLVACHFIEEFCRIPARVEIASEYRYRHPVVTSDTLFVTVSQSGETADTLAALREAKRRGHRALAIVNVVGSTIARESDGGIYMHAGPEIGVASTKAFVSTLTVLALLAIHLGRMRNLPAKRALEFLHALEALPKQIETILAQNSSLKKIAKKYAKAEDFFFLGRGYTFPIALEGALKLKEISYIHAEGYSAAEMKHGPIALIDAKTPTVFLVPQDAMYDKTMANLAMIRARQGPIIALATEGDTQIKKVADDVIYLPKTLEPLYPILASVPLQLFAYHIAVARGCDVDKPRNLAKSVTVE